jgi:hypothetical protein
MNRKIEFLVKGIVEAISGRSRFIGRCTEDAIRVGDVFTQTYFLPGSSDSKGGATRSDEKTLQLRIVNLQAYGRELRQLGPGMTGTIDLDGTGADLVQPGALLGVPDSATTLNQVLASQPVDPVAAKAPSAG